MPDVPARRFRFSLVTLLVAVNVAGVLVWANVRRSNELAPDVEMFLVGGAFQRGGLVYVLHRGWPFQIYSERFRLIADADIMSRQMLRKSPEAHYLGSRWAWGKLLGNAVVSLALIAASALLTESCVARTKRHDR